MSDLKKSFATSVGHTQSIRMGKMSVARGGMPLRSLLGSCVGVALYNRRCQIGGLAHIVLPRSNGQAEYPGKFVDSAIPLLVQQLNQTSITELKLVAKLAGGATMFATGATSTIGEQNVQASIEVLKNLGIPIVAQHCGGTQGRRVTLDTNTGRLKIEVVGQTVVEI